MNISIDFFCDSCHQLSTADNSCQKLMKIKINLESRNLAKISPIECTWKLQSNFIHISCHQLSTAVKSWWQLIKVDENKNQPKINQKNQKEISCDIHAKFELCTLLVGQAAKECDARNLPPNGSQVKLELTQALHHWY